MKFCSPDVQFDFFLGYIDILLLCHLHHGILFFLFLRLLYVVEWITCCEDLLIYMGFPMFQQRNGWKGSRYRKSCPLKTRKLFYLGIAFVFSFELVAVVFMSWQLWFMFSFSFFLVIIWPFSLYRGMISLSTFFVVSHMFGVYSDDSKFQTLIGISGVDLISARLWIVETRRD